MKNGRFVLFGLAGFLFLGLFSCNIMEFDTEQPEISITHPPENGTSPPRNAVVGGITPIRVETRDNEGVNYVEFYIDGVHDTLGDDFSEPFEYQWAVPDSFRIGSRHKLYAMATDFNENKMVSNFVRVYYQWFPFLTDPGDASENDVDSILVRNTAEELQFRVVTTGEWENPRDSTGFNAGIFLDTDLNIETGYSSGEEVRNDSPLIGDSLHYDVGEIGADYLIVVGLQGDGIWKWNSAASVWQEQAELTQTEVVSDTNIFVISLSLEDIGAPERMNLRMANVTYHEENPSWDWVPDEYFGTYFIDEGLYVGE